MVELPQRAISLESGTAVIEALRRSGVNVVPVLVDSGTLKAFDPACCDRVFIALHGRVGKTVHCRVTLSRWSCLIRAAKFWPHP